MFRSDSIYFLGFQTVSPLHSYKIETRFESSSNHEFFYKCDVIVQKQNNVFTVISLQNFKKKKQDEFVRHDLLWENFSPTLQAQQGLFDLIVNNVTIMDVLKEENWLLPITDWLSITDPKDYKIEDDVYSVVNQSKMTLSNEETFFIKVELHECFGINYMGSVYLYKDFSKASNFQKPSFEDRKNAYLLQLLSNELFKQADPKMRLHQVFMQR